MVENFDRLEFNRKVDTLVAIHIFKHKDVKVIKENWCGIQNPYYKELNTFGHLLVPCYSTLLTSAWDLVRKFTYMELIKNTYNNEVLWQCKLGEVGVVQDYNIAETEQLAICYAGLKVVGFDVKGFLKEEEKVI